MVVISSRAFLGWTERDSSNSLSQRGSLSLSRGKTKLRIGNNRRRETWERDWFLSHHFWSIKLWRSRSASPHTPASLRDISRVPKAGDKRRCLSSSAGQWRWATVPVQMAAYMFTGVSSHSKPMLMQRQREIIVVSAGKHTLLPQHTDIQFAGTEDVTQGVQLCQRTLPLLCCSYRHNAADFCTALSPFF